MKTNFYILLILLLSFSYGDAQSKTEVIENDANKVVLTSSNNTIEVITDNIVKTTKENDTLLIDTDALKASIARTSDIRNYLNHVRNVENLKLLFPKINKSIKV